MSKKERPYGVTSGWRKTCICIGRFGLKFCMDLLLFLADTLLHRQCFDGSRSNWNNHVGATSGGWC